MELSFAYTIGWQCDCCSVDLCFIFIMSQLIYIMFHLETKKVLGAYVYVQHLQQTVLLINYR
jgi:hypothetical protein